MKLIYKDKYLKAVDYKIIDYTNDYHKHLTDKYETPEQKTMNNTINKIRTSILNDYCGMESVLDYGAGTGNFIKYHTINGYCFMYGYELIPKTIEWLKKENMYIDPYKDIPDYIKGITMWDVLEHLPEHDTLFNNIKTGTYLFVSIPIFDDLDYVKKSKHYIPNEHLWYFSELGFIQYMEKYNFRFINCNHDEHDAGRDDIETFVLKKI